MKLVIIESPYAGNIGKNILYVRRCMLDCLKRGEAPFASHALYTQPGVLADDSPEERTQGIEAGLAWGEKADATIVYTDLGTTPRMTLGIERAQKHGRPVEYRQIGVN